MNNLILYFGLIFLLFLKTSLANPSIPEKKELGRILSNGTCNDAYSFLSNQQSQRELEIYEFLVLAYAYLEQGRNKESQTIFSNHLHQCDSDKLSNWAYKVAKKYPESATVQMLLGDALARKEDFNKAVKHLDKAVQISPNYSINYLLRGSIHFVSGSDEKALENFDKALNLNPSFVDALLNKAIIFAKKGDITQALSIIDKAIQANPKYPLGYNIRGILYAALENWKMSKKDLRKAFDLDNNQLYKSNLLLANQLHQKSEVQKYTWKTNLDQRGTSLIASSTTYKTVQVDNKHFIDIFIVTPSDACSSIEGSKTFISTINKEVRILNELPEEWKPLVHIENYDNSINSSLRIKEAAKNAYNSNADYLILLDVTTNNNNYISDGNRYNKSTDWVNNVHKASSEISGLPPTSSPTNYKSPTFSHQQTEIKTVSLPNLRHINSYIDHMNTALDYIDDINTITYDNGLLSDVSSYLKLSGAVTRDFISFREGRFHLQTSHTLEESSSFLLDKLGETYKVPGLGGLTDMTKATSSAIGRQSWSVNDVSQLLEGFNKVAWSALGYTISKGNHKVAATFSSAAHLTVKIAQHATYPVFENYYMNKNNINSSDRDAYRFSSSTNFFSSQLQKSSIENYMTHIKSAAANGVHAIPFSEIYGKDLIEKMDLNPLEVLYYDEKALYKNFTTDLKKINTQYSETWDNLNNSNIINHVSNPTFNNDFKNNYDLPSFYDNSAMEKGVKMGADIEKKEQGNRSDFAFMLSDDSSEDNKLEDTPEELQSAFFKISFLLFSL